MARTNSGEGSSRYTRLVEECTQYAYDFCALPHGRRLSTWQRPSLAIHPCDCPAIRVNYLCPSREQIERWHFGPGPEADDDANCHGVTDSLRCLGAVESDSPATRGGRGRLQTLPCPLARSIVRAGQCHPSLALRVRMPSQGHSAAVNVARMYSRFMRAMFSTEIPAGQAASHS